MCDKDEVRFSPSESLCLQIMLEKEQSVYRKSCRHLNEGSDITTKDRMKIIDWCYRAVECLRFDTELVEEALEIGDRFMSRCVSTRSFTRSKYQVVLVASLYIAMKKSATGPDVPTTRDFEVMCKGKVTARDIIKSERAILKGLDWRIWAPTNSQMAYQILNVARSRINSCVNKSVWNQLVDNVLQQTEFSVRSSRLASHLQSSVAIGAILNAVEQTSGIGYRSVIQNLVEVLDNFDFHDPHKTAKNHLQALLVKDEKLESSNGGGRSSKPSKARRSLSRRGSSSNKSSSSSLGSSSSSLRSGSSDLDVIRESDDEG